MADNNQTEQRALSIFELPRFALYGKPVNNEQFSSPVLKVSVLGASLVSFTCYPNAASDIEKEFITLSLHQTQIHPFLEYIISGLESGTPGEYVLSRNQVKKYQGEEKRIDGELYCKVSEDGVVFGVKNKGKTFLTFGLRELSGYEMHITTDGDTTKNTKLDYALHWFKELKRVLTMSALLIERDAVRKLGGNNVSGGDYKATEY